MTLHKEMVDSQPLASRAAQTRLAWVWDILLIGILVVAAFFRFTGTNWDDYTHLHPDERFLTMVSADLQPVKTFSELFDTAKSTLNPNNRGYGFYVYGTLPLFIVRYAGEWLEQAGYNEIHLVGRQVSAVMDLLTVLLVYLIANRLYRKPPLGLLAAAFAALQVLPIEQAHYYTVDTFTNFFGFLAFYFAVRLLPTVPLRTEMRAAQARENAVVPAPDGLEGGEKEPGAAGPGDALFDRWISGSYQYWETTIPYILFGIGLGMAVASKINAAALAILLPGAVFIRWLSLSKEDRERWALVYARNLLIAAIVSIAVFRIFQPYAFKGPGLLDFGLNPDWIEDIKAQRAQAGGDVDFPPALQWARRPMVWFPFVNMVVWGLGLPLGILSWVGFAWMGWRMLKGEWRIHSLVWGWTAFYFAWQASTWNPTMRYLLLIYPTLAVIAAWTVFALAERARQPGQRPGWWNSPAFSTGAAWVTGTLVLTLTLAWAWAFLQIYMRPLTRVAASRWVYENMAGPINLPITHAEGTTNQPLAFRSGFNLFAQQGPLVLAFQPQFEGQALEVNFDHINSPSGSLKTLTVLLSRSPDASQAVTGGWLRESFQPEAGSDARGQSYRITFNPSVPVKPGETYYLILTVEGVDRLGLSGTLSLGIFTNDRIDLQVLPEPVEALQVGSRYENVFKPVRSGTINTVEIYRMVDWEQNPAPKTVRVSLFDTDNPGQVLGSGLIQDVLGVQQDVRGQAYTFKLDRPVEVDANRRYMLELEFVEGPGRVAVYGSKPVNETSWDDAVPWSLQDYDRAIYSHEIFNNDLNFEMYWDDNPEKLERFVKNLDQADYIFISSNRQWGTTTRVPERYPLTSEYYRQLIGCPAEKEITWCYSVAQPGDFQGNLGFELTHVFASEPNLGSLVFNSQFAEEAFSVYDHPKVFVFQKTDAYDSNKVHALLNAVDLSKVIHLTPRKAGAYVGNLLLPDTRLEQQRSAGTWSDLFDSQALFNRYPALAMVLWYLVISLLGWVVYPLTRLALRGLPDRGYPLARTVGMLALAYPVWLLGSYQIPFTPGTISAVFVGLVLLNAVIAWPERRVLVQEIRERWKYYLLVEGLMLAFFLLFLVVRFANPDLWHPAKGGEKPMDFSYFNAVLKSTSFPPYDPWFAGGYINYYYFGFVLVGVPVKWLGILPAVAYNLILPTLYGMLALGAFSTGWNLLESTRLGRARPGELHPDETRPTGLFSGPFWAGLSATVALALLGNMGTVRMIWHGIQRLSPLLEVPFEEAPLATHLRWTVEGMGKLLTGTRLPYGPGDWYWIPSRAFPGEPITEFPAFTFLYADLHAHMIALPLTVLALAWALSVLLGRWDWKGWVHAAASFALGGLVIGALRPTNTWDWPTYLALGSVAILYTSLRYGGECCSWIPLPAWARRLVIGGAGILALVALSSLFFMPYNQWYGQGYNAIERWNEGRTPFWSYTTHWGLFLFVIISWLAAETIQWMAATPLSGLRKLRRWRALWIGASVVMAGVIVYLLTQGVQIAWLAILVGAWAALLLLRPGITDGRRAVLFLVGTAMVLTLFVELFRLQGDIGRMNTVFKFYLQAWTLLAVSAGAALFWLLPFVDPAWWMEENDASGNTLQAAARWSPGLSVVWQIFFVLMVVGAALFPLMAGADKMSDRMVRSAPPALNGMLYMDYATYNQEGRDMDLSQDARAIRWMQENVQGSPVIVEANTPEYRWGSRFTIYTGLPGVVGWNWHQRQQRAVTPDSWVFERVNEIGEFYRTYSRASADAFLKKYDVKYIVVGQLERAVYEPMGLVKFEDLNGDLWQEVYRDGETVIYRVN